MPSQLCQTCGGRSVVPTGFDFTVYDQILARRIDPDRELDQYTATPDSVHFRISFLVEEGATRGRDVAILGDDDFTSIGICLFGSPRRVVVFDIDQRILDRLALIASERGLPLDVVKLNLREDRVPAMYEGRFDTVFTDPSYMFRPAVEFLQRARTLNTISGSRIYLAMSYHPHISGSNALLSELCGEMARYEYFVARMIPRFHDYEGGDGVMSCLVRFDRKSARDKKIDKDGNEWSLRKGPDLHPDMSSAEAWLDRVL